MTEAERLEMQASTKRLDAEVALAVRKVHRFSPRFYSFYHDNAQYFEDRNDGAIYGPFQSFAEAKLKMAELRSLSHQ